MASANIVLFRSKLLKDGTHPIVLLVTHHYQRRKFSLKMSASDADWDDDYRLFKPSAPNAVKRNKIIQKNLFKAEEILYRFKEWDKPFSMKEFEAQFIGIVAKGVFPYFEKVIDSLKATGKIGNANVYRDAYRALKKYHGDKDLSFGEITYSFLLSFEESLRVNGVMENSISVYMRTLRALFNRAIKEKLCPQDCYPFKTYQVNKLKGETSKRPLTKNQIDLIKSFVPDPNTKQELSKHLFLFSFYTMGMNFTDIARLQWSNISDGRILYQRSKTGKRFSIKILPPVQEILDYYREINPGNSYIFPILDSRHKTPEAIANRAKSGLKRLNKHLKEMAGALGIEKTLTSYVARHSWATIMKREGVSTAVISEGLGHQSESVTQIYLDSFENETLDRANEKIL